MAEERRWCEKCGVELVRLANCASDCGPVYCPQCHNVRPHAEDGPAYCQRFDDMSRRCGDLSAELERVKGDLRAAKAGMDEARQELAKLRRRMDYAADDLAETIVERNIFRDELAELKARPQGCADVAVNAARAERDSALKERDEEHSMRCKAEWDVAQLTRELTDRAVHEEPAKAASTDSVTVKAFLEANKDLAAARDAAVLQLQRAEHDVTRLNREIVALKAMLAAAPRNYASASFPADAAPPAPSADSDLAALDVMVRLREWILRKDKA